MALGQLWAGRMFGTNTGNVFAELNSKDDKVEGVLRVNDEGVGVFVYNVTGKLADGVLELEGAPKDAAPEGVALGNLKLTANLAGDGTLRGKWETSVGTGGVFVLHPHGAPDIISAPTGLPERIHSVFRQVGAVRLFPEDFRTLVSVLQTDFQTRPVVTYRDSGTQVSRYAEEVVADIGKLGEHRYLQISVQQPDAYGINRSATVELNAEGSNEVRVQGVQHSWVLGKAETLATVLRRHEKRLSTTFARYGIGIYQVLFFASFALMPQLPLGRRFIFLAVALGLLVGAQVVHRRCVPLAVVYLSERKPSLWQRTVPSFVSWIIAATAGLAGAVAFEFLRSWGL